LEWRRASLLEKERKEVLQDITKAIADNELETANKLIDKYQVVPVEEMIENETLKRQLSGEERQSLKSPGKREEYREQREELRSN
jgi:hypothetical protein